ncbi:MAG TPA: hypothetical protein DD979_05185 [Gammaproteobacteria bacterium]|jgi:cytochrome oxidase assembly protein ShyY1|nr:hypothetical protein [Gammaproteobacteria bacterium]
MAFWRKPLLRLQWAGWVFSLSALPILLLLVCLPVLIRLGLWQLERAVERKEAMDAVAALQTRAPVSVTDPQLLDAETPYVRVRVQGEVDWSRQFLLDNQVHNTVAGYEVLTPIVFSPGRAILVSRGWMPPNPGKKPDLSPPDTLDAGIVELTGLAVTPPPRLAPQQRAVIEQRAKLSHRNEDAATDAWPIIILEEDFAKLSEQLGLELVPRVLQPDAIDFGYTRVWQPVRRGPTVNYGYAAQWFGMALLLVGAVIVLNLRRCRPAK